jgi:flagellar assembly protein FliH
MSSRARRISAPAVEEFGWAGVEDAARRAPLRVAAPGAPAVDVDDQASVDAHLAGLERDAFAKGFAQGERAGNEAAAKRGEAMIRRLTETLGELTTLRDQMIHQTEQQMVQLALAVARRVVHREISIDPDLLIAMARVALDRLGDSAQVTVRLNPDDFQATTSVRAAQWTGTNVTVVADARIGRGGCLLESDFGTMNAGADAQIHEIARALLGEAA